MNTSEIIDRYQRRHTSIKVLAELNACSTKEIKDILSEAGVLQVKVKPKLPDRLAAAYKVVRKDIEEEIMVHKNAAVVEKMEMSEERDKLKAQFKELLQQYKEIESIRKQNIQVHKDAVEALEKELKEVEDYVSNL